VNPVRAWPSAIYAIADAEALAPRSLAAGALAMAEAGIATIQLRAKRLDDRKLHAESERAVRALEGWSGTLWIDDRVDLARILPFAGVHLGQLDLPPSTARKLLPETRLIGASTHGPAQFDAARADPAVDWIAFGPVFPTTSKRDPDPVVGLEALAALARRDRDGSSGRSKPLVAIGGIDAGNLRAVLDAGADAAVVLSAVSSGDVAADCRRLLAALAA
jgi:thiamine-phosphate pyrophosphorylase